MTAPRAHAPRRIAFHPLSAASFDVVREVLGRDDRFRLSHLGPLAASLLVRRQRRDWIAKAEAAAAAVPADWHIATPPVFVIGFWRSGTTLLHELLAADRSFAAPSLVDVLWPSDAPYLLKDKRKAFDAIAAAAIGASGAPTRLIDRVEVTPQSPQEEELALCHLGAPSFFGVSYFPKKRDALIEEALFWSAGSPAQERWRAAHQHFLRLLTVKYPGRRLLLKNPANATRIRDLMALYPQARFVRIDRAPHEVIPSFQRMTDHANRAFSFQGRVAPIARAEVEGFHARVMAKLDADWIRIPPHRRTRVGYERLVQLPLQTVDVIYRRLDLERSAEAAARQRKFWLARGRNWTPESLSVRFGPTPAGELAESPGAVSP